MLQSMQPWLDQYGNLAIFVILMLGMLWLPLPEETFLTALGILIHHSRLEPVATAVVAFAGTGVGVTGMYLLGRSVGYGVIHRFGRLVRITPQRLKRTHDWFDRHGKWTLTFGYYIPYVRHINALVAGASRIRYGEFALFAYPGGAVWVITFLSLGYFVGDGLPMIARLYRPIGLVFLAVVAIIAAAYTCRRWRRRKRPAAEALRPQREER